MCVPIAGSELPKCNKPTTRQSFIVIFCFAQCVALAQHFEPPNYASRPDSRFRLWAPFQTDHPPWERQSELMQAHTIDSYPQGPVEPHNYLQIEPLQHYRLFYDAHPSRFLRSEDPRRSEPFRGNQIAESRGTRRRRRKNLNINNNDNNISRESEHSWPRVNYDQAHEQEEDDNETRQQSGNRYNGEHNVSNIGTIISQDNNISQHTKTMVAPFGQAGLIDIAPTGNINYDTTQGVGYGLNNNNNNHNGTNEFKLDTSDSHSIVQPDNYTNKPEEEGEGDGDDQGEQYHTIDKHQTSTKNRNVKKKALSYAKRDRGFGLLKVWAWDRGVTYDKTEEERKENHKETTNHAARSGAPSPKSK